jgi:hypothetical protein
MSSTTMSASIQSTRCALVADKDAPAFLHSPARTDSPKTPSPKSPVAPLDKQDVPAEPEPPSTDKVGTALISSPSQSQRPSTPQNDDVIDKETFDQIRELDESNEFVSEMIEAFFEQATATFVKMDTALCVYLISLPLVI